MILHLILATPWDKAASFARVQSKGAISHPTHIWEESLSFPFSYTEILLTVSV